MLIETLNPEDAVIQTEKAIQQGINILFEAAFRYHDILIRADILTRNSLGWMLHEVKATTYNNPTPSEKEGFQRDLAIQTWVLQKCGLNLSGVYLMHLNSHCIYPELDDLFTKVDYWLEIQPLLSGIEKDAKQLQTMLSQPKEPGIAIGSHCDNPRKCEFKDYCWSHMPKYSAFSFPSFRKKWTLLRENRFSISNLQESDFSSKKHKRVLKCYQQEKPLLDKEGVQSALQAWDYPISYFDLEAVSYPIPRYPKSHPYKDLPFQYSCHIQKSADADLEHHEFLFDGKGDPCPAFIDHLLKTMPDKGAIVVYHKTYELNRLKELAEDFPEFATQLTNFISRIVDLKKVIEDHIYYPEFQGSFSIKKVAPALLGDEASYKHLAVSDGIDAMVNFQRLISLNVDDLEH